MPVDRRRLTVVDKTGPTSSPARLGLLSARTDCVGVRIRGSSPAPARALSTAASVRPSLGAPDPKDKVHYLATYERPTASTLVHHQHRSPATAGRYSPPCRGQAVQLPQDELVSKITDINPLAEAYCRSARLPKNSDKSAQPALGSGSGAKEQQTSKAILALQH